MNDSQRHRAWTVAGWLGIVSGAIGILYSWVIVLFFLGSAFDSRKAVFPVKASELLLSALSFALLPGLFFGISALVVFAGLGLVRRRSYGRICTLLFGALSIIYVVFAIFASWQDFLSHAWRALQETELPNGPSLASRLVDVLGSTPIYLAYAIGIALLCRSVYSHREAFNRDPPAPTRQSADPDSSTPV